MTDVHCASGLVVTPCFGGYETSVVVQSGPEGGAIQVATLSGLRTVGSWSIPPGGDQVVSFHGPGSDESDSDSPMPFSSGCPPEWTTADLCNEARDRTTHRYEAGAAVAHAFVVALLEDTTFGFEYEGFSIGSSVTPEATSEALAAAMVAIGTLRGDAEFSECMADPGPFELEICGDGSGGGNDGGGSGPGGPGGGNDVDDEWCLSEGEECVQLTAEYSTSVSYEVACADESDTDGCIVVEVQCFVAYQQGVRGSDCSCEHLGETIHERVPCG